MKKEYSDYFNYLQTRSRLGGLYRKYFLYPILTRQLSGKVLDIGCGLGDFLKFRPNTVGLDINPLTVDYCKKVGLEAVLAPDFPWPFSASSFDGAVLDNVLEHLADPLPLLTEIKRILKNGGILLIGVPGIVGYRTDPDHKVYYNFEKLTEACKRAGFRKQVYFHTPFNYPVFEKILKRHCLYGVFSLQEK